MIDGLAGRLLGAHVGERAHRGSGACERDVGHLGDAEVHDLRRAFTVDHHVGRLHVPVDDPQPVGGLETSGELQRDVQGFGDLHRAAAETLLQGLTLVIGHRQERPAGLRLAHLQDRADVGMVQSGCGTGLHHESLSSTRVTRQVRGQELQGDRTVETGVDRLVHDAHTASAEVLDEPVLGDHRPGLESRVDRGLGHPVLQRVDGGRVLVGLEEAGHLSVEDWVARLQASEVGVALPFGCLQRFVQRLLHALPLPGLIRAQRLGVRLRRCSGPGPDHSLRGQVVGPCEHQRDREADDRQQNDERQRPIGQAPARERRCRPPAKRSTRQPDTPRPRRARDA